MRKLLRPVLFRLAVLTMVWALPVVLQAQSYTNNYGLWTYTTTNGTVTITEYTGSGGAVTIPDRIPETTNGLPVSSIGGYYDSYGDRLGAFEGCNSLTTVTIGTNVANIGDSTFQGCSNLTGVTIPDSITSIGVSAFYDCSSLTNVAIGTNVTNIGLQALDLCSGLTAITVDPLNSVYSSLDGVLFDKSKTTLIQFPGGKAGSYTIPDTVTSIGEAAFNGCSNLEAPRLAPMSPPSGTMRSPAARLTNVTIGTNIISIGHQAFSDCISLTAITAIAGNSAYSSLDRVLFDKSQTMLIQCPGALAGAYTIPNSVTSIGLDAFVGCNSLTNVTIPNSVTSIRDSAFYGCPGLTGVTIPNSVTSIENSAFESCNSLTSVTIGNSVTNLGIAAFHHCTVLTNVTIANGATSLGILTFSDCSALTSIAIPNTVTSIEGLVFDGCTALTNITIPNSVTNIADGAFIFCFKLKGVYFQGNAPSIGNIGESVFLDDNYATVYYLPGTTGWSTAFGGRPAVRWNPQVQTSDAGFGVRTNQFGFNIAWASGMTVVVEASANLANPTWLPLATNTLSSSSAYFSDPHWTNYPGRFYRLRWP